MRKTLSIVLRGARTNNLKSITLDIPLASITLITGASGTGKSSLAMDTLFMESYRKYLQANSHLGVLYSAPFQRGVINVDYIGNTPAAVALRQQPPVSILHKTVGEFTGIEQVAATLFALYGTFYCYKCNYPVESFDPYKATENIFTRWSKKERFYVLAPLQNPSHTNLATLVHNLAREGFIRFMIDGKLFSLEDIENVGWRREHTFSVVVDRLTVEEEYRQRIHDSLHTAMKTSERGEVYLNSTKGETIFLSENPSCSHCGTKYPLLTPYHYDKDHPSGRCPYCNGSGCNHCSGSGRNPLLRFVKLNGRTFSDLLSDSLSSFTIWLQETHEIAKGKDLLRDVFRCLDILKDFKLHFLSLNRSLKSLSAGELQKLRLAELLKNSFSGLLYILDEPFNFLDPQERLKLHEILLELVDKNNTIVLVDHSSEAAPLANNIVEMGPSSGKEGGYICFSGSFEQYKKFQRKEQKSSLRILKGSRKGRQSLTSEGIFLSGATGNNLQNVSIFIPLGGLAVITGPVGSGKTTLIFDTLYLALQKELQGKTTQPKPYDSFQVRGNIGQVLAVRENTSTFRTSSQSVVATFLNLFTPIRQFYGQLKESREKGFTAKHFSYNSFHGACPVCNGKGIILSTTKWGNTINLCPQCNGRRYKSTVLSVKYKGYSIEDVLNLTLVEISRLFSFLPLVKKTASTALEVGLGHLKIGQSLSSLSGGEIKRLWLLQKLACIRSNNPALFLFDHPLVGLHWKDKASLFEFWRRLLKEGHTLVVCESTHELSQSCDWLIELGPGGPEGGKLLYMGTPS